MRADTMRAGALSLGEGSSRGDRRSQGPSRGRALLLSGYALGVHMVVTPLVSLFTTVVPWQLDTVAWRFATFGMLADALVVPVLGAVLLCVIAAVAGHRRVLFALAVSCCVAVLAIICGTGLFALDTLQVRGSIQPGLRRQWDLNALRAVLVTGWHVLTLGVLAIGGFRTARSRRGERRDADAGLLVARPQAIR